MQGRPRTRSCELQHPWGRPNALRTRRFVRRTAGAGEVRCSWLPHDHRLALRSVGRAILANARRGVGGGCERLEQFCMLRKARQVVFRVNQYIQSFNVVVAAFSCRYLAAQGNSFEALQEKWRRRSGRAPHSRASWHSELPRVSCCGFFVLCAAFVTRRTHACSCAGNARELQRHPPRYTSSRCTLRMVCFLLRCCQCCHVAPLPCSVSANHRWRHHLSKAWQHQHQQLHQAAVSQSRQHSLCQCMRKVRPATRAWTAPFTQPCQKCWHHQPTTTLNADAHCADGCRAGGLRPTRSSSPSAWTRPPRDSSSSPSTSARHCPLLLPPPAATSTSNAGSLQAALMVSPATPDFRQLAQAANSLAAAAKALAASPKSGGAFAKVREKCKAQVWGGWNSGRCCQIGAVLKTAAHFICMTIMARQACSTALQVALTTCHA